MEDDNQKVSQTLSESTETVSTPSFTPTNTGGGSETPKKSTFKQKWFVIVALLVVLLAIGVGVWLFVGGEEPQDSTSNQTVNIDSYDACVAAGYPVMESFPEQCSVPGGQTFTNTAVEDKPTEEESTQVSSSCVEGDAQFSDKDFGASFCYPSVWGTASVMDAKIATSDTGYREAVRFSANTKFIVGGVSEDWTTTVGRGVACQEPNNAVPGPDSYNTEWHDITGEGMAVEFATRSLVPLKTGYDMTETVSNLVDSGVCVQGHKVINGSRYLVLSAAYYSDFSESVATPKAHMDNPNILFTNEERLQLDSLLASATNY